MLDQGDSSEEGKSTDRSRSWWETREGDFDLSNLGRRGFGNVGERRSVKCENNARSSVVGLPLISTYRARKDEGLTCCQRSMVRIPISDEAVRKLPLHV